jgi:hypothetical protein
VKKLLKVRVNPDVIPKINSPEPDAPGLYYNTHYVPCGGAYELWIEAVAGGYDDMGAYIPPVLYKHGWFAAGAKEADEKFMRDKWLCSKLCQEAGVVIED